MDGILGYWNRFPSFSCGIESLVGKTWGRYSWWILMGGGFQSGGIWIILLGMRIITLFNQKGGVGKTTTTVNLGSALAHAGRRVILIDLDPQANLTAHVGVDVTEETKTIYQVLTGDVALADALVEVGAGEGTLRVVPSVGDLAAVEQELVQLPERELILRRAAEAKPLEADYVLIDCPPSLGLLTLNALSLATEVFIPMQAHFLALQGMARLLETVSMVRQQLNPKLVVSGILFCQFEAAARLSGEVSYEVEQFLIEGRTQDVPWSKAISFDTTIRRNIKLAEAPSFGKSILDYAPGSAGAADYSVLAEEIMKMEAIYAPELVKPKASGKKSK